MSKIKEARRIYLKDVWPVSPVLSKITLNRVLPANGSYNFAYRLKKLTGGKYER